jgi:type II secretory pathway component PulF
MAIFNCRVADRNGKITEFTKEASSEDILIRELQSGSLFPIQITEQSAGETERASHIKRFKQSAILDFTSTTGLLLSSGLSLKDSLQVALTIFKKGHEHQIITQIMDKIDKGASFYNTLTGLGDNFPPLYRGLVRIGEKIGSLDSIFVRLAKYLADSKKIKDKVVGALIYPLVVLGIVLVGAILMTFVAFPAVTTLFTQMGVKAVEQIQSRLFIYNLVMGIVFVVVLGAGTVLGVLNFLRRRGGAIGQHIDRLLLSLPVGGRIILYRESMNFLFAMETLTASGYSIEEALQEAALVIKNLALKTAVSSIRERVIRGDSIAAAFGEEKLFPERISQWLLVGERSGQVEKVFAELNNYYQAEIERWTTRFMSLIDPVLMIIVGAAVLAFVLLFLLPIFTMSGSILQQ